MQAAMQINEQDDDRNMATNDDAAGENNSSHDPQQETFSLEMQDVPMQKP